MSQRRPLIIHYTTSQLLGLVVVVMALLAAALTAGFFYGDKTFSEDQGYIEQLELELDQQQDLYLYVLTQI